MTIGRVTRRVIRGAGGQDRPDPDDHHSLDAMKCAPFAADGHLELFKSTKRYDGAVSREQHGYPPSAELLR